MGILVSKLKAPTRTTHASTQVCRKIILGHPAIEVDIVLDLVTITSAPVHALKIISDTHTRENAITSEFTHSTCIYP